MTAPPDTPPATLRPELLHGPEALKEIRQEWQAIAGGMSNGAFHHSPGCFDAALRFRAPVDSDAVMAIARDSAGRLALVMPLRTAQCRIRRMAFRCWSYPRDPDRPATDIVTRLPAVPMEVFDGLRQLLAEHRPDIGLLALDRLDEDSPGWATIRQLTGRSAFLACNGQIIRVWTQCSFSDLLAGTTQKFRAQLRRARRTLAEHGTPGYRVAREPGEIAAALEVFQRMEAAGWKGSAADGNAILRRRDLNNYVQGAFSLMAESGECEIHSLWSGKDCVASLLMFRGARQLHAFKITYDERWENISPGHSLLEYVLQHCCDDPAIDACIFGTEAAWLQKWRPERRSLWAAYVPLTRSAWLPMALLRLPTPAQLAARFRG